MTKHTEQLLDYLETVIGVGLEAAFDRGSAKYDDAFISPEIMDRFPDEAIRHIRELHVGVRLREAEHAAEEDNLEMSLEKVESAISYLTILHYVLNAKLDPELLGD